MKSPASKRAGRTGSDAVTLRIPASTSNLGSGFDTLGLALRLHSYIRLTRLWDASRPALGRFPNEADPEATMSMIIEAAGLFFRCIGTKEFGFQLDEWGKVPLARGLGASAVLRLGVVAGLNELTKSRLTRDDLLGLVAELEGHPDNASPAVRGGFTVSGRIGGSVQCLSFRVNPRVKFIALVPAFGIHTETARRLLPESYSRPDTAHALNRAALITAALGSPFFWLTRRIFHIGRQAIALDRVFAGLYAQGIGIWMGGQAFINMGVNLGVLPTKGLTLPLMSFGGSALVVNLVALAIVLRVDIENRQLMRGGRT